ncbi:UDP-3-O-(3-hydroxymyristoyl)glucosamine N-acyltransferase [Ferrimonas balearica]|uniref:UDP-3-O-(3-hydroxymyristoyl)glucosamine N-acyltransferase n=1 Tax=Ferrimonas balearica TaxID=44012 RepID=UPI001C59674C|nr:UDP-3-O-(3-hydroxymyristoyl)glucosamine N-acyltransferase [Ferrimonas balearica]MBW3138067.1 UDP-3-O-(3-hydroxymyristoyl)glucosamine N-acyltransferase [Ferrimonas balearica]MBW3164366.1 UDP-3-O-(3-hydroxymyristoyl)glucosamine N-acyltransferase [Ferrimonas balearica]MBY6105145.1 UDP-3-O-(3-hydroxymyristoyl)glucosamine N-acyltransferase [Ferrimonas balearica]
MTTMTLAQLASALEARLQGNGDTLIEGVATLGNANASQIAFLANSKYRSHLDSTAAGAVILSEADAEHFSGNALIMANPYLGYAQVAQLLDTTPDSAEGIHPTAVVHPEATLGDNVSLGANVVIEAGAIIGDNVQIGPGCVIGRGAQLGAGTKLWANVTVYHNVIVGQDCLVHSGAVIGSDGFGYANEKGQWVKIPQLGSVRIGDRVEIGANTCIDRGALDDTIIEEGVILDNLVQIAHNDVIGAHTAIAGATVLAGSTTIGKYCIIGGNSAIAGHLTIADGTHISGMTGVTGSIKEKGLYASPPPLQEAKQWRKNSVRMRQLDEMYRRLRELEKQMANLATDDD